MSSTHRPALGLSTRRVAPVALLCALVAGLSAQDLGVWQQGPGAVGAAPALPGTMIGEGGACHRRR